MYLTCSSLLLGMGLLSVTIVQGRSFTAKVLLSLEPTGPPNQQVLLAENPSSKTRRPPLEISNQDPTWNGVEDPPPATHLTKKKTARASKLQRRSAEKPQWDNQRGRQDKPAFKDEGELRASFEHVRHFIDVRACIQDELFRRYDFDGYRAGQVYNAYFVHKETLAPDEIQAVTNIAWKCVGQVKRKAWLEALETERRMNAVQEEHEDEEETSQPRKQDEGNNNLMQFVANVRRQRMFKPSPVVGSGAITPWRLALPMAP